jgi:homeobox-leucine zipper protein
LGLSRTLDLASSLEGGPEGGRLDGGDSGHCATGNLRSVLTIAFQFTYDAHTRESCAAMARQYVRTVVASVQRVAMALAPSRVPSHIGDRQPQGSPDALVLAQWVLQSYRLGIFIACDLITDT